MRKRERTVSQITQVALRIVFDTATARNKLPAREKKSLNHDSFSLETILYRAEKYSSQRLIGPRQDQAEELKNSRNKLLANTYKDIT